MNDENGKISIDETNGTYIFLNQTPTQFVERRITTIFGVNSNAIKALDLVREEMCIEKGFKRDDGQDYYNHCVDVANTLLSFSVRDEDAICAALLHDIVEDVDGYTEVTIRKLFNPRVAELVMFVTKDPDKNYKDPEVLKEYLKRISGNMMAAVIKTADRMHNMMTLQEKTFEARYRKAMETKEFYMPFFKECRQLYPRYENLFYAARTQIYPLIYEIESFYGEILKLRKEKEELEDKINKLKGKNKTLRSKIKKTQEL